MHLVRLPSGKWRVIVQHDGNRKSGTAPSKAGAQQLGATLLLELGAKPTLIGEHTVATVLDEYLRTQRMSEAARYDLTLIVRKVRKTAPFILDTDLERVDAYTIERWYERLTTQGWTIHRVRKLHTLLHAAFGRAVAWSWAVTNPAEHARPPSPPTAEIDTPGAALTGLLLTAADAYTPGFGTFIRVAANTGARRGELCALQWGDLDPTTRTLVIRRSVTFVPGKGMVLSDTKTGAKGHRAIGLGVGTVDALETHQERVTARWEAVGITTGPTSWMFTDDTRTPWTPSFTSHAWKTIRTSVPGAEHVKLHALRHGVATRLLASGMDPRTVAGRLGHANPNLTLSTYARFVPARDRAAADYLEEGLD